MPEIPTIFEKQIDFEPGCDFEAFLRQSPAKWAVYLMTDASDRPIQLLCVKNLRASLKRRLSGEEAAAGLSKRVDYREVVRHVRWRRVDSAFEADWIYFEVARQVFPQSYRGMVGFRPAWFLHVNPESRFPRYVKTIDLTPRAGMFLGPVEDKHAAARLIELVEDAFDLCRHYHLLTAAPDASACAYKGMGKCPAPCDGSISMDQYRRLLELSEKTLVDPSETIRQQTARMQSAAAELRFELAAKIKAYVQQISQFGKGAFRHVGRLKDFCYLSLQHGPRPHGNAKVFLITPGKIQQILCLINEPQRPGEVLAAAVAAAEHLNSDQVDQIGAERIGIVAHHLFSPKATQGVFMRMEKIDERSIAKAYRDLKKQTPVAEETEQEGVLKELQSIMPGSTET